MSIKSVLGRKPRKRRKPVTSKKESGANAGPVVEQPDVLGQGLEKAKLALNEASQRVSKRATGLDALVGYTLGTYYPCEMLTKPLAIGIAATMADMLADPDQYAKINKRGFEEIEKLVKPAGPLFILAKGLDGDVKAELLELNMTIIGPFVTGRPNVPSLIELAGQHKLTVLRFDELGDKQAVIEKGVQTEALEVVLAEHQAALAGELGGEGKIAAAADQTKPDDSADAVVAAGDGEDGHAPGTSVASRRLKLSGAGGAGKSQDRAAAAPS
ncbi:hypothetical protein [Pelagibacterium sp. H642]|uniref:hypothetical protein n=1 Tax=Pelagibacterium sp. H642 TaxID=1881069 RepID=UPI002815EB6F|nr:hypothetical protein [Pelagibacterium sp. H642]WMT89362.1 hypothetical protein NO934_11150 [Pelagibacterium sp. H642]